MKLNNEKEPSSIQQTEPE